MAAATAQARPNPTDDEALPPDAVLAAFELASVAALWVDGDRPVGRIRWASRAASALLGWPEGALVGQPALVLGLAPPDRPASLLPPTDWPDPGDVVAHRADGTTAELRLQRQALASGTVVVLADVDAQRHAAGLLAASERRFRALAEQAPIGIISSEVGLRAGYANPQSAALLGTTVEALLGTGWIDAMGGPDLAQVLEGFIGVLEGGELDVVVRRGDQHVRVRASSTTLPTGGGGFVASLEDVTAARRHHEALAHEATHDGLTGLANRTLLLRRVEAALAEGGGAALAFIDLDAFKEINDSLGHAAGDAVLVIVADRLRSAAAPGDTVARLGGDEFVVLRPAPADAAALVATVAEAVPGPAVVEGHRVDVSASVGGVQLHAGLATAGAALRAADAALYEAKQARRRAKAG